jgi:leucyl-tRNA synthetase
MPPEDAGLALTAAEIADLADWIAAGAADPRELEARLGGMERDAAESWWSFSSPVAAEPPAVADPALVADDQVTIAVQVNGKRRDEITIARDLDAGQIEALVLSLESVARALEGRAVKKVIVVPGRIANIVG